jgi:PHD/YefM family antitoxin component YafN of YafNO toxin-antitoxin module
MLSASALHNPQAILDGLATGPVFVSQAHQPMAVLISLAQWDEVKRYVHQLEVIVASERIMREVERDPSSVVSHTELKRRLAEKRVQLAIEQQAKNK